MFTVYVLLSSKDQRTYVGYTGDFPRRLEEHNAGKVPSTRRRVPLTVLLTEQFGTMAEAKKRELWWKSSTGRRNLKKIFSSDIAVTY